MAIECSCNVAFDFFSGIENIRMRSILNVAVARKSKQINTAINNLAKEYTESEENQERTLKKYFNGKGANLITEGSSGPLDFVPESNTDSPAYSIPKDPGNAQTNLPESTSESQTVQSTETTVNDSSLYQTGINSLISNETPLAGGAVTKGDSSFEIKDYQIPVGIAGRVDGTKLPGSLYLGDLPATTYNGKSSQEIANERMSKPMNDAINQSYLNKLANDIPFFKQPASWQDCCRERSPGNLSIAAKGWRNSSWV